MNEEEEEISSESLTSSDLDDTFAPKYEEHDYWDKRYETEGNFDWYFNWKTIEEKIGNHLKPGSNALVIGCGDSPMSHDMPEQLFNEVISIDISKNVINEMKERYKDEKRLKWAVMDCSKLEYEDNSFDYVFDKGTFDAISCGITGENIIAESMKEIYRVLKPGGKFIQITYSSPSQRFPAMRKYKLNMYYHPPIFIGSYGNAHYFYVVEKMKEK